MASPKTPKVWFITGASRGLGAEITKAVLASGAKVVASARKIESLDHLGKNESLVTVALDVTDEAQAYRSVDSAVVRFGRIDVLVNNAGFGLLGAIEEATAQEIETLYRTNVFGLLNVTRAVLPVMRRQRSGHVINMSSVGGYSAFPGWGLYSSTKFAVEAIGEALRAELAPLGIHATIVEPGAFRTDFLDSRSLATTTRRISDYAATAGETRKNATNRNHEQPGDPQKLAQALLHITSVPDPPLRLPLGNDTIERIVAKNSAVEKELLRWRDLSSSTDFDEPGAMAATA